MGLVNGVVEACKLKDAVRALAQEIAANAPLTVRAAKQVTFPIYRARFEHIWQLGQEADSNRCSGDRIEAYWLVGVDVAAPSL